MFSGIIQQAPKIVFKSKNRVGIQVPPKKYTKGDSIAINGICLTLVNQIKGNKTQNLFFDVSDETRQKTTFDQLKTGDVVNMETALKAHDLLGGHLVQGHVDGVGQIVKVQKKKEDTRYWFRLPKSLFRYLVPKGSITIDGVSLTLVDLKNGIFSVALIPFTLAHTNLGKLMVGSRVNIEVDILGKYVLNYLPKKMK